MKQITKFVCPVCKGFLVSYLGSDCRPVQTGIYIECPNIDCGMADWGHSINENKLKEAYDIFLHKCTR